MQLQKINQQESFGRIRRLPTQKELAKVPFSNKSGVQAINSIKPNKDLFNRVTNDSLIDLKIIDDKNSVTALKIKATPRSVHGKVVEQQVPFYTIDSPIGLLKLLMQINDKTKTNI